MLGRRFFLCVLSYWALAGVAAAEWHRGNLPCGSCHLADEVNPENAGRLVADEASLCRDCHRNAVRASHPVGVRPANEPPAGLPLDSQGEISCSTCHQVHGEGEGKLRLGLDRQQLCQSCHQPGFFAAMKDGGTSVMAFGHLDAGTPFSGDIDNFSIRCMACHENSADAAPPRTAVAGGTSGSAKSNHPIGQRYDDSLGFGGYRHPNRLPETIMLPDGRLSCLSCHVGYSRSHGALVMENRAENLCTACHAL